MRKEEFIDALRGMGWTEDGADTGEFVMVSPNGHYCHEIGEFLGNFGTGIFTGFTRYGVNSDVCEIAAELGAISEHDDEYRRIACGNVVLVSLFDLAWCAIDEERVGNASVDHRAAPLSWPPAELTWMCLDEDLEDPDSIAECVSEEYGRKLLSYKLRVLARASQEPTDA
jgi:hypothetical protein